MAKKRKTVFVCQECGYESPKWMGQCICGAWNSMVEEVVVPEITNDSRSRSFGSGPSFGGASSGASASGGSGARRTVKADSLSKVRTGAYDRIDTGIGELNRVLGGGLVQGSLVLISGEPGIGKSTLILQAAASIASSRGKVLYVSGEESEEQIKMRADRICPDLSDDLFIMSETNMENILQVVDMVKPCFMIIDSIQTMYTAQIESAPGSVSQIRACGNDLMKIGKVMNIPVFVVAHVTKSGDLAGPKIIEHLVDCVLNFTGERNQDIRILRCYKNRFGNTSEIGAFEMAGEGLIEIKNLSATFIEGMDDRPEGAVIGAVYEGSRPMLLEVQALVSRCSVGFARRTALGMDLSRLNMIIAVLERKAGLNLTDQDIYMNIVGGMKPEGTYLDLSAAMAIYSSFRNIPAPPRTVIIGEIGLTGELRAVQNADKIIKEAERMGFENIILPAKNVKKKKHGTRSTAHAPVPDPNNDPGTVKAGQHRMNGADPAVNESASASSDGIKVIGVSNIREAVAAFKG